MNENNNNESFQFEAPVSRDQVCKTVIWLNLQNSTVLPKIRQTRIIFGSKGDSSDEGDV